MVRAYAKEWKIDPNKIGIMGFSAGAELAAPAAVLFEDFDKKNNDPADPFAGISSRPDFAGIIYPGPSPFARNRTAPPIPKMSRRRSSSAAVRATRAMPLGARLLRRDADVRRAEYRNAHLRQRPSSRRPAARRQPDDAAA